VTVSLRRPDDNSSLTTNPPRRIAARDPAHGRLLASTRSRCRVPIAGSRGQALQTGQCAAVLRQSPSHLFADRSSKRPPTPRVGHRIVGGRRPPSPTAEERAPGSGREATGRTYEPPFRARADTRSSSSGCQILRRCSASCAPQGYAMLWLPFAERHSRPGRPDREAQVRHTLRRCGCKAGRRSNA
jgi:hypothetical protein